MELFTKKIGTVFLKETSDVQEYIEKMEHLKVRASDEVKQKIERQISYAKYGETGEKNIAFQLKSSGIDMYVLHDIFLTYNDIPAQIDYLVITRKHIYVIECKNLYGNIEIDNKGAFIRHFQVDGEWKKEGMESPITQNERHLLVLKELRKSSKGKSFFKKLFQNDFSNTYKSLVVLANPKTILNDRYAKKEIKQIVIRADQLISYIKATDEAEKSNKISTDEMYQLAQFYLAQNQPKKTDYTLRYENMVSQIQEDEENTEPYYEQENENLTQEENTAELIKQLKAFRLKQSRKENMKPYYIFNDAQMMDLIEKNPQSKEELQQVSGFGAVKVEKYGDSILEILNKK